MWVLLTDPETHNGHASYTIQHQTGSSIVVHYQDMPFTFFLTAMRRTECEEAVSWCAEHFGPSGLAREMSGAWSNGRRVIRFRHAPDAVAFRMRWC